MFSVLGTLAEGTGTGARQPKTNPGRREGRTTPTARRPRWAGATPGSVASAGDKAKLWGRPPRPRARPGPEGLVDLWTAAARFGARPHRPLRFFTQHNQRQRRRPALKLPHAFCQTGFSQPRSSPSPGVVAGAGDDPVQGGPWRGVRGCVAPAVLAPRRGRRTHSHNAVVWEWVS